MPPATPVEPVEVNLLREWREPVSPRRLLRNVLGSLAVHALIITALLLVPEATPVRNAPVIEANLKNAVHLVAPRIFEPTQTSPSPSKAKPQLDARSAIEGRQAQAPRFRPPAPTPGPPSAAQIAPPLLEAPKIQLADGPAPLAANLNPQAPLAPPPSEKPRLELQNVPGANSSRSNPNPNGKLRLPNQSLEEMARAAMRPGGAGGVIVGDTGENLPDIPGTTQAPSQCQVCSTLQLKSDPQSVDFKPYLIQVISIVKRNWLAVVPESARMGRRDSVVVEFSIDRGGSIPKLVIVSGAGIEAFNRAAVAGLSASVPFPPLPAGYKGDRIVLDMTFLYNIARGSSQIR